MARMKYLVLHCTATPEGREVSAADIRHWDGGRWATPTSFTSTARWSDW